MNNSKKTEILINRRKEARWRFKNRNNLTKMG